MRFCKECGSKLQDEAEFCPECGTSVSSEPEKKETQKSGITQNQSRSKQVHKPNPKRPMSRKMKIILSSSAALVVALAATYFILSSFYTKEKAIEQFKQALADQDEKTLADMIYSDNSSLEIDETAVGGLLDFLDDSPSHQNEIFLSLERQVEAMDSSGSEEAMADTGTEEPVLELTKSGKKLLLFDEYKFKVQPYYFTIQTNYEDTDLFLNDEKIATADSDDYSKEVGPFMPGLYQVKAELENEYATFDNQEDLKLFGEDASEYIEIYLDGNYVDIEAESMEGTLIINGDETDLDLKDNPSFGPIPIDGSVILKVKHDFPWGEEVESEEIPVEDTYVYMDNYSLPVSDDLQTSLMETYNEYAKSSYKAYNKLDAGKLKNAADNLLDVVEDDIEYMDESDSRFKGVLQKLVYDLDSFSLGNSEEGYYASAMVKVDSKEDNYYDDDKPELKDNEDSLEINFIYDEDEEMWLVDDTYSTYSFDGQDTEEFVMDEDADDEEDSDADDESGENDEENASGDLDDYNAQEIEYARVWLEVNGDEDIDTLQARYISSGEPVNSDASESADYPEEVIRLTADSDDIVTYSGNGDGTLNLYDVPSDWEDVSDDDMEKYTEDIIGDTESVSIDPNEDDVVIKMIKKLDMKD